MPDTDLPTTARRDQLHTAATRRDRVRIRGTVTQTGAGYSGRYRNAWLVISTAGAHIRITASRTSRLGTARAGAAVDLAATLTGIHDLTSDEYHAEHARLLALNPGDVADRTA